MCIRTCPTCPPPFRKRLCPYREAVLENSPGFSPGYVASEGALKVASDRTRDREWSLRLNLRAGLIESTRQSPKRKTSAATFRAVFSHTQPRAKALRYYLKPLRGKAETSDWVLLPLLP